MKEEKPKKFIVYSATHLNTTPPQAYIGISSRSLQERRDEHERDAKNEEPGVFYNAMRAVGSDHFNWEILMSDLPEDLALQLEGAFVDAYRNIGCEILTVSCSRKRDLLWSPKAVTIKTSKKRPPLTKQEKQQRRIYGKQGNNNPDSQRRQQIAGTRIPVVETNNTGITYESISAAAKETGDTKGSIKKSTIYGTLTRKGNIYKCKNLDDSLKEHQTLAILRVKCLTLDKVCKDEEEAAENYKKPSYIIRRICKGKQKYVRWKGRQLTFCYVDDQGNEILEEKHKKYIEKLKKKAKTHIAAFPLQTDYIEPEYSAIDAKTLSEKIKEATGKYPHPSHILEVCEGKRQHSCGFRFAYWDPINRKATQEDLHKKKKINKQFRAVHQLDPDNRSINYWNSLGKAGKALGISSDQIRQCCEGILYSTRSHDRKDRLRFAFDNLGKPDLKDKHTKERCWPRRHVIGIPPIKTFRSWAEWMREMDIRRKYAKTYLTDLSRNKPEIKGAKWYDFYTLNKKSKIK